MSAAATRMAGVAHDAASAIGGGFASLGGGISSRLKGRDRKADGVKDETPKDKKDKKNGV